MVVISGIGGGMVRDILLDEIPVVLRHELYAIPALLGAAVVAVVDVAGATGAGFLAIGAASASLCGSSGCATGSTPRHPPANLATVRPRIEFKPSGGARTWPWTRPMSARRVASTG